MIQDGNPNQSPVLTGWKEIAKYLGMGVRTVQRYEQGQGLPIHRPGQSLKGPVLAVKSELDEWVGLSPKRLIFDSKVLLGPQPERDGLRTRISRGRQLRLEALRMGIQLLGSITTLQKTIAVSQSTTLRVVGAGTNASTDGSKSSVVPEVMRRSTPSRKGTISDAPLSPHIAPTPSLRPC